MKPLIFISHSSKDKDIARRLSGNLWTLGYEPWLDEWEISVGECILTSIEKSIDQAAFVVVLLSKHAVESAWVDREWKAKYWDEVERKAISVFPARLDECNIPTLLKTRKYADFRKSHAVGFYELARGLEKQRYSRNYSPILVFEYPDLTEQINNSIKLDILGYDLSVGILRYSSAINNCLKHGGEIRAIYTKPTPVNLEMITKRAYMTSHTDSVAQATDRAIVMLEAYKKKFPAGMQYGSIDFCPSYGIIRTEEKSGRSTIYVKLIPFKEPTGRYPTLYMDRVDNTSWYEFFNEQFNRFWNYAEKS
jgi:TIR domain-containing protein